MCCTYCATHLFVSLSYSAPFPPILRGLCSCLSCSHDGDDKKRPVIIHRAILGSVERMIAILTENYGGKWFASLITAIVFFFLGFFYADLCIRLTPTLAYYSCGGGVRATGGPQSALVDFITNSTLGMYCLFGCSGLKPVFVFSLNDNEKTPRYNLHI